VWLARSDSAAWAPYWWLALLIGALTGALTILVDVLLKGFSLRGLTALSFGLAMGGIAAAIITHSPLFEFADEETKYLVRIVLFVVLMYVGAVIALRGKDEFNLVIPYVRFVPHDVEVPLVVVDTSALIDGRIVGICESRFLTSALIVPQFVVDELQRVADSGDPQRQSKGRRGIETLRELQRLPFVDLRIQESDVSGHEQVDMKLIYLAKSLKAKLLTLDYNLARLAELQGVDWLNISALSKALATEVAVGERLKVDLIKPGRESGQGVGFLNDGSMVVINNAADKIGTSVQAEVVSVLPSAGGKMVFAKLAS